ncbi:hypothetical protein A0O28_0075490 [Trichoderma guizhouense]|uniref:Uncharacterized protein n=1 Tax=Trichoderma guizhouense TaxID=1491466 RepID=A0A1T3CW80_9HYPO|nr:hypothetical protein A0O28_0075490 [Trichoderma guizhouense]
MAIWDGEQSPGTARSESRKTLANNDKACLEAELWELGEQTLRQNRALLVSDVWNRPGLRASIISHTLTTTSTVSASLSRRSQAIEPFDFGAASTKYPF